MYNVVTPSHTVTSAGKTLVCDTINATPTKSLKFKTRANGM